MSGYFTDRDERMWQRRAEERIAAPLDIGYWIQALRSPRRAPQTRRTMETPRTPEIRQARETRQAQRRRGAPA
ncbi:hypothetical protein [Streptomyces sp. NPDC126499]|uniref:hypothetical protein n=1 Tax=Streptomyces sp. NPDC126499 TaxID=3155314 RepID=UPI003321011F